jgi:hypothetical protein
LHNFSAIAANETTVREKFPAETAFTSHAAHFFWNRTLQKENLAKKMFHIVSHSRGGTIAQVFPGNNLLPSGA